MTHTLPPRGARLALAMTRVCMLVSDMSEFVTLTYDKNPTNSIVLPCAAAAILIYTFWEGTSECKALDSGRGARSPELVGHYPLDSGASRARTSMHGSSV